MTTHHVCSDTCDDPCIPGMVRDATADCLAVCSRAFTQFASGEDKRLTVIRNFDKDIIYAVNADSLAKIDFAWKKLIDADFKGHELVNCIFFNCDLRGADFRDADLRGAYFSGANCVNANFEHANLEGVSLKGTKGWVHRSPLEMVKIRLAQLGITSYERLCNKTFRDACLLYATLPTEEEQLANIQEIL